MTLTKLVQDPDGLRSMKFMDGGKKQSASYTWFRGSDCNFGPTSDHLGEWQGYERYFLEGLVPTAPCINASTRITAFGSCFAANISSWLARRKYRVLNRQERSEAYIVRAGEGFVNTYSILQQFEWAFEGKQPTAELWHGYDARAYGYDEIARQATLEIFNSTDLFILTFGLSEVWYDTQTNEVFWRAVPRDKYDPNRHAFRTVSPEENYLNIKSILSIIRRHRPDATIVMTLSPIPLVATFRPLPCLVSNAYSKASLRCAMDNVLREQSEIGKLYYWPSYEIVLDGFRDSWEDDLRHVKQKILTFIMKLFERAWCEGGVPDEQMSKALYAAKWVDGSIPRHVRKQLQLVSNPEQFDELCSRLSRKAVISESLLTTVRTVKLAELAQAIKA